MLDAVEAYERDLPLGGHGEGGGRASVSEGAENSVVEVVASGSGLGLGAPAAEGPLVGEEEDSFDLTVRYWRWGDGLMYAGCLGVGGRGS